MNLGIMFLISADIPEEIPRDLVSSANLVIRDALRDLRRRFPCNSHGIPPRSRNNIRPRFAVGAFVGPDILSAIDMILHREIEG
jgi:hypothetical protein